MLKIIGKGVDDNLIVEIDKSSLGTLNALSGQMKMADTYYPKVGEQLDVEKAYETVQIIKRITEMRKNFEQALADFNGFLTVLDRNIPKKKTEGGKS